MKRATVLRILRQHRARLDHFGVKSLAVFGSVAPNKAGPQSDVDIVVEFEKPVGFFEFVRLKMYLETLLDQRVDLVTPDAIRQSMRERILSEAIRAA